jgi:hypothetical protein
MTSIEGLTDHARTSDIPHRRSPRGSFSSQSPENTCRPVERWQQHRGLLCDGLDGAWRDQRACCWRQERFIAKRGKELFEALSFNRGTDAWEYLV